VNYLRNVHNLAHNSKAVFFRPSAYFIYVILVQFIVNLALFVIQICRVHLMFRPGQLNTAHTSIKTEIQIDIFFYAI
jgi:hypothetical protein